MTEWTRGNTHRAAQFERAILAARCGSAPTTRCWRREAGSREIYGAERDQRAPSPPLRDQYRLQDAAGGGRAALFRHVARRHVAGNRRNPRSPWFIGVQFHPELKSKPFAPHPLFTSFIRAALRPVAPGLGDRRCPPPDTPIQSRRPRASGRPGRLVAAPGSLGSHFRGNVEYRGIRRYR